MGHQRISAPRRLPSAVNSHARRLLVAEIDQATESIPRLRAKCRAYLDFLAAGSVGPRWRAPPVLITTSDQQPPLDKFLSKGEGLLG